MSNKLSSSPQPKPSPSRSRRRGEVALAILFAGAAVASAAAQDAAKPAPLSSFHYVGAHTRVGIGIDDDGDVRGEAYQVLQSSETSATLAELWAAKRAGGGKLSHHWASGDRVDKVFVAFDQAASDLRKVTLGGGQEWERLFWNAYLSKGIGKSKLVGTSTVSTIETQTGTEGGRPFVQDRTTTVTSMAFRKPYDWSVGGRLGHFYAPQLLRLTAGLDYDWGKYSARQWTASLMAEKFFEGSPISLALSGETSHREGDFELRRRDHRALLMLRYELGAPKSSFRPARVTRQVTSTERVPDPNWTPPPPPPPAPPVMASPAPAATATAAPVAAAPAAPTMRTETRTVRSDAKDAQETYFDLGSARLKPAAMRELDALVARIEAQRPFVQLMVNIVGHTCPTGSDRNNFPLSEKRAEAVKAYLVSKGIAEAFIVTEGKAGKAPKYPEIKGQSFRNRRADTDVLILKERTEQVQVPVAPPPPPTAAAPRPATPPAPAAAPAPAPAAVPATRPMIERTVTREVVEDAPNPWRARALLNSVPHRTAVDTYGWVQTATTVTLGEKRFINRPPVAVDDSITIPCNTSAPTAISVLSNDSDPDGDTLNLQSVTAPGKGSAAIAGRAINYTPTAAACGSTDTFTYTINDGKGLTATARVNITVQAPPPPPNTPPIAVDDRYVVPCNAVNRVFDVLANDRDPDGDALTIVSVTQPTAPAITASVAIGGGGRHVVFNGGPACFPSATFTYTVSDGKGGTATATVTVIDP